METAQKPLEAFAWPGGYPIAYLGADDSVLCPYCATIARDQGETVTGFINWEGDALYCEECNDCVASAYGEG